MPKYYRLSRADFTELTASRPRREHGALFSLSIGKTTGTKTGFAVVVSKKVSKKAIVRNLIKRRSRAALRTGAKNFSKLLMLAFHAKPAAAKASYIEIEQDILALLARA